jgi:hypothetical protein
MAPVWHLWASEITNDLSHGLSDLMPGLLDGLIKSIDAFLQSTSFNSIALTASPQQHRLITAAEVPTL